MRRFSQLWTLLRVQLVDLQYFQFWDSCLIQKKNPIDQVVEAGTGLAFV